MTDNPEKGGKSRVKSPELQGKEIYSKAISNSPSKMQYSISKTPRWQSSKKLDESGFYNLPSTTSNRSASFGFGQKLDISKLAGSNPSPNSYTIQSQFQKKRPNSIAIGLGRELVKVGSAFQQKSFQVPGPGNYEIKDIPSQRQVRFSGRNVDLTQKWILSVPGPGSYKTVDVQQGHKSSLSKYSNCRTAKFSKASQRDQLDKYLKKQNVPGPGQYSKDAHELIERFPQKKGQAFSKSGRPSIARASFAPGPGSYNALSQFVK